VHPDTARELKTLILERLRAGARAFGAEDDEPRTAHVAVGLAPLAGGRARVAVRLEREADRGLLPDLGPTAERELEVRVIGPVRTLSSPAAGLDVSPAALQRRVRPLRPGLSIAHAAVTACTLGGFVRTVGGVSILSNNHVLAASDAASPGDAVLQAGPADGGVDADRVATLTAFERFRAGQPNLVDAAVALVDPGVEVDPGALPGGALTGSVARVPDIDPDEDVQKVGRTTGHTHGRISAVEVDGVAVQYDDAVYGFDDQVEIEGRAGGFSAGGDSGSVIWRSRDRAPLALLFAGSSTGGSQGAGVTFANPLVAVLDLLSAEWVTD
jgi:hypothetical protein